MTRTYRRSYVHERIWALFGRPGTAFEEAPRMMRVPDGSHTAQTFGLFGRRRKRLALRAWRHEQRIRLRKGFEVERYDRAWLD